MIASIDLQVLLRLRPFPMRGHRLLNVYPDHYVPLLSLMVHCIVQSAHGLFVLLSDAKGVSSILVLS